MNPENLLQAIDLSDGFRVDASEAWRKITSRQFAGPPARAFGELIVNYLDSYPPGTPWEQRRAAIESEASAISITDWGEGMSLERLRLLLTLGGSDKRGVEDRIGRFGIGFFAIFNPTLKARQVTVTTRIEDALVQVVFDVVMPGQVPVLSARIVPGAASFGTRVRVDFAAEWPVQACLAHARERLGFYPCPVTVDGAAHRSLWADATAGACTMAGGVRVLLEAGSDVRVLCRYQPVITVAFGTLFTGGRNRSYDLRDFRPHDAPWLPGISAIVECADLRLTIARDSYFLDQAAQRMNGIVREALLVRLEQALSDPALDPHARSEIVLANHYALSRLLGEHVKRSAAGPHAALLDSLLDTKVYRIMGQREPVSLRDLQLRKTAGVPLFHSASGANQHWLGGHFRHDFIVLPPRCTGGGGAPDFADVVLGAVFGDAVNLDTIREDRAKVAELVARGVVDADALSTQARLIHGMELTSEQQRLLDEIDELLAAPVVAAAVKQNLALPVERATAGFFRVADGAVAVSSGLFTEDGQVIDKRAVTRTHVLLALRIDDPVVTALIASTEPHRAYYALTLLSHELARCQELLVPDTPAYWLVTRLLAADLRRGLTRQLLSAA